MYALIGSYQHGKARGGLSKGASYIMVQGSLWQVLSWKGAKKKRKEKNRDAVIDQVSPGLSGLIAAEAVVCLPRLVAPQVVDSSSTTW